MILLLVYAAASCMGAAMRQWAVAAEADGCLSPAPTWAMTYAGIYTCSAAMLGAIVASGLEGTTGRLSVQLAAALTVAHCGWAVRVVALGVREVYGTQVGSAELTELTETLKSGVNRLAETLRAPRETCLRACRRHVHTALIATLSGAGAGLLGGIAENAANGTASDAAWTTAAGTCAAVAAANAWNAVAHDEAGAQNAEGRRERPPRMGRRAPNRTDEERNANGGRGEA